MIRFAESFRLHAAMAEFLRQEVYRHDGIAYHSQQDGRAAGAPGRRTSWSPPCCDPEYPLVVVVHDEAASQVRNPFEQALIEPVLRALADPARYGLDAEEGLGVVVPHRAQRAALQQAFPELCVIDPASGLPARSAIDTVERFQGGERTVILVSATESDRAYLLASSEFLLDPRRLTVAVSRAKRKMILVASRSIFSLFSPDEEMFANSLLWKNLLLRTCTTPLLGGAKGRTKGMSYRADAADMPRIRHVDDVYSVITPRQEERQPDDRRALATQAPEGGGRSRPMKALQHPPALGRVDPSAQKPSRPADADDRSGASGSTSTPGRIGSSPRRKPGSPPNSASTWIPCRGACWWGRSLSTAASCLYRATVWQRASTSRSRPADTPGSWGTRSRGHLCECRRGTLSLHSSRRSDHPMYARCSTGSVLPGRLWDRTVAATLEVGQPGNDHGHPEPFHAGRGPRPCDAETRDVRDETP